MRIRIAGTFDRLPFEIIQLPVGDTAHLGEHVPGPERPVLPGRQYPAGDFRSRDGMPAPVGMVALGHVTPNVAPLPSQGHERPVGVRQPDAVLPGQLPDLPGMERQRSLGIEQVRGKIGRRRAQNHPDALGERPSDHFAPRRGGPFQPDGAVVQRIVDKQYVGTVREHLGGEAPLALLGVLTADSRHDAVYDGIGIAPLDDLQHLVRIGLERPHVRSVEIPRRHAVPVKHEVEGPVPGPPGVQFRTQGVQIVFGGSHPGRSRERRQKKCRECEDECKCLAHGLCLWFSAVSGLKPAHGRVFGFPECGRSIRP